MPFFLWKYLPNKKTIKKTLILHKNNNMILCKNGKKWYKRKNSLKLILTNCKKVLLYIYIKQCTLGQVVYIVCVCVLQLHILFFCLKIKAGANCNFTPTFDYVMTHLVFTLFVFF